jgi:plastocyanin
MRLFRLVLPLAIVVLVSACGGSGNDDSTPAAQQPPKSASSTRSSSDTVTIDNFKFGPATLTVKRGAKVTITNRDSTTHTATADDGAFDTGDLDPGSSKTITLSKAGRYAYHCQIHSFMKAAIVVT